MNEYQEHEINTPENLNIKSSSSLMTRKKNRSEIGRRLLVVEPWDVQKSINHPGLEAEPQDV